MSRLPAIAFALALPLAAQTWDLRVEVPFPKGQNLPGTLLSGSGQMIRGNLDTGNGFILSASHRIIRVGPILKLEWVAEASRWKADGQFVEGTVLSSTQLQQSGLGVGLNAQLWLPFTGAAGEFGVIERAQRYKFEAAGAEQTETIARPWFRVGLRYRFPLPLDPYVAASFQQPITKNHPVTINSVSDVAGYLRTQGSGQEFERMWTFGVGVMF